MKRVGLIFSALLIFIVLLAVTPPVQAEGRADVFITDNEGNPIQGAAISIVHSWLPEFGELLLFSDAKGRFSFEAKAIALPYCIRIDTKGYKPVRSQIWLAENSTIELTFQTHRLKLSPAIKTYNKGAVALNQGYGNVAEKAFRKAIEIDGDFALPRTALAQILLDRNQPAKAVRQVREALRIQPEDIRSLGFLYEAEKMLGNDEAAREALRRLLKIGGHPSLARRIYNEGVDKLSDGDKQTAKKAFAEAILLHPGFVLAHLAEAEIALLENRLSAAKESVALALKIDPENRAGIVMSNRIELAREYEGQSSPSG